MEDPNKLSLTLTRSFTHTHTHTLSLTHTHARRIKKAPNSLIDSNCPAAEAETRYTAKRDLIHSQKTPSA